MLIDRQRYSKNDLIKAILEFKIKHNDVFPERRDWLREKMKPSLKTFERKFGGFETILVEAKKYKSPGQFENELLDEIEKKKKKKELKEYKKKYQEKPKSKIAKLSQTRKEMIGEKLKKFKSLKCPFCNKQLGSFECPSCGEYIGGEIPFNDNTKILITNRFLNLLKSHLEEDYFNAVMDCIFQLFPGAAFPEAVHNDGVVRQLLKNQGYVEKFDLRHGVKNDKENSD